MKDFLWTKSRARLQLVQTREGKNYNWIFLPGGPGLGSEYFFSLFNILALPGNTWRLDLPGDGSNIGNEFEISKWQTALLESARAFETVIMVGHSRGGMFLLSLPEIESRIQGLVLLDSAPDRTWIENFSSAIGDSSTIEELEYQRSPNDETLRKFVLAGAAHMFTKPFIEIGREILKSLPYNHLAIDWALEHFDPTYSAKWVPKKIPTLILSGAQDLPTPLKLFSEKKEFHRNNILMTEIKDAGHFPWVENPKEVMAAFNDFYALLLNHH